MRRTLGILLLVLATVAIVVGTVVVRVLFWFGPELEDRDYAGELHVKALEASGVSAEGGAAGWATYERFIDIAYEAPSRIGGAWGAMAEDGGAELARYLEVTDAIAALEKLATAPPAIRPYRDVALPQEQVGDPLFVVDVSSALSLMLREAAVNKDASEAIRVSRCMNALARTLQRQASLDDFSLGLFVQRRIVQEFRHVLLERTSRGRAPSVELCDGFMAVLEEFAPRLHLLVALEGDRLEALSMLAEHFPRRKGLQLRSVSAGAQGRLVDMAYRDALSFARRLPPDRWGETCPQPELRARDAIAASSVRDFQGRIYQVDLAELATHATILMLHIERHIAQAGAAPESLDELGLPPKALYDPWSGQSYGYRLLLNDQHGRAYLLWAVGANGEDNGGTNHPGGNEEALWDGETPADWIVNLPRGAEQ